MNKIENSFQTRLCWRSGLKNSYKKELLALNQLPLSPKHSPILIGTGMGQNGNFEISYSYNKKVLMVWATSNTWDYILKKIIKHNKTEDKYYVEESKKNCFLNKLCDCCNKPFLCLYPKSPQRKLLNRVKPWVNKQINNNNFGKWVELAYLLPSYIEFRFGPELQLAGERNSENLLQLAMQYAKEAKKFLDSRGSLIGYEVGESGLWLDGNPIYLPDRDFRLIWGLGGRSDFAIQNYDNDIEYWELKTFSPNKPFKRYKDLVRKTETHLKQVLQQAPMQLVIYRTSQAIPNIIPIKKVGVLGVGLDSSKNVVCHNEDLKIVSKESNLLELPSTIISDTSSIFNRQVITTRAVQWNEKVKEKQGRIELAAEILKEAVNLLVKTLMESNEWDSILQALDAHWQLKYYGTTNVLKMQNLFCKLTII